MVNQELLGVLRKCAHHLHRMSDGRAGQKRLLGILAKRGEMSQRELQDVVDVRSATLSEVLGKLETGGLIVRRASEEDRRNMVVSLTEQGAQIAQEMAGDDERLGEMFSCLTDEEKQQMTGYLTRMSNHWNETFAGEDEHHAHRGGRHRDRDQGHGRHGGGMRHGGGRQRHGDEGQRHGDERQRHGDGRCRHCDRR